MLPRNTKLGHDAGEGGCVARLSCGEDEGQGPAVAVGAGTELRGQSAPGPADGMVVPFAGRGPLTAPAACWWARTIVESTETTQLAR